MFTPENVAAALLADRLPLTAYIASVTRDFHLAEDIFQEVCAKAVGRAAQFETCAHVVNWARVAGRNRAIDTLRSRDGNYVGLSEELLDRLSQEWPGRGETEMVHEALAHCLDQITPRNRELLRLRYFEGRRSADVAEIMGRKPETVYQALTRIHHALAACVRARLQQTRTS